MSDKSLKKGYEDNDIKLRGILVFGAGLVALIIVTFGLMWYFQQAMEAQTLENEKVSPMAMKAEEKLPPEPRLQAAPGFGVDSEKGRVNLELTIPQAEYRELEKQWKELREKGHKVTDPKTGKDTWVSLPLSEAKERLLKEGVKARSEEESKKAMADAGMIVTTSSAGRIASEKRR